MGANPSSQRDRGPLFGVQLSPMGVVRQTVAVPLAELEQNQDKLLPDLQARHMGYASLVLGVGACVVLH